MLGQVSIPYCAGSYGMGRLLYEDIALQSAGKHTAGASSYVIAQARARFASALGLEMKTVELIPNKMAGKPQAELRGQSKCSAKLCTLPWTCLSPAMVAPGGSDARLLLLCRINA